MVSEEKEKMSTRKSGKKNERTNDQEHKTATAQWTVLLNYYFPELLSYAD